LWANRRKHNPSQKIGLTSPFSSFWVQSGNRPLGLHSKGYYRKIPASTFGQKLQSGIDCNNYRSNIFMSWLEKRIDRTYPVLHSKTASEVVARIDKEKGINCSYYWGHRLKTLQVSHIGLMIKIMLLIFLTAKNDMIKATHSPSQPAAAPIIWVLIYLNWVPEWRGSTSFGGVW